MGDTYNNVGATGLVARSNHYCPVIMGDNIICWQLGGDNGVVMDRVFVGYTLVNQPSLDQPMYDIYYIMGWIIHYCTIRHWTNRCWTGRPDRSPLHSWGWTLLKLRFDKMSNEGVYNVLPHTKIRFGGFGGPSRAIRKIQIDADRGVGTTFRRVLGRDGRPFSASRP